jgi:protocatechuate 4,5-dioxygenase beta chain
VPPFKGELDLSWHLIESLVAEEFDLTTCQEMLVDHAFTLPMALLFPGQDAWPVTTVPVCINTVQFPLPSAARCYKLGQAIGRAIESWDADKRVVVIGTGGLSHQLDGERAGFINKDFDLKFMESLISDPTWATKYSITDLVELTGTQGVELVMWLAARGALGDTVKKVHANYHIPISNTAAGLMVLENTV